MKERAGVGMPEWLYLNEFGRAVNKMFGAMPYLVGSAAKGKAWRDVDVRLILVDDPEAPEPRFQTHFKIEEMNDPATGWAYMCAAWSELGRKMTGLPIDFQIQTQTFANGKYGGEIRTVLGLSLSECVK